MKVEPKLINAKGAAFQIIQSLGISCPDELVIEDVAMSRGVLVMDAPLEGMEAILLRKGKRGIIRVKAGISEIGRRRFAIAHELGHWELHSGETQWNFCSEDDLQDYTNSILEIEANAFASELLMPSSLIRSTCEEAYPDLKLIQRLANEFRTSLTSAAIRFVEESRRPCIIIFSRDGKVRWWRKSDKCNSIWIEKDWEIQEESVARSCMRDEIIGPDEMKAVEASAWFGSSCVDRTEEVQEQSMKLGRYPVVLTLLWVP